MTQVTTVAEKFLADLVAVALERPLRDWKGIPDCQIKVPEHLVKLGAYYIFVDRGSIHGFHEADFYDSLAALRAHFRRCVASLEDTEGDEFDGSGGVGDESSLEFPINLDEQHRHRTDSRAVPERHDMKDHIFDRFGNVWLSDPPCRSDLSHEAFLAGFTGFPLVLVEIRTDRVFAGGQDEDSLELGLDDKALDASRFQIEPGPFSQPVGGERTSRSS